MRLVSVTIAKNEADIIESFVRYHLNLFDHMLIIDHDSSDDTGRILRALAAEGLPISVFDDHSLALMQGPKTTTLARRACAEHAADFVFPLDTDEFVKTTSRQALELAVSQLRPGFIGTFEWQNYLVSEDDNFSLLDPAARITNRATVEAVAERKIVLPASAIRDLAWEISPGNHYFIKPSADSIVAASQALSAVSLAHYALRSEEQVQRKVLLGWLTRRLQNPVDILGLDRPSSESQSWHLRQMACDLVDEPNLSIARIREMAWRYYVVKDAAAKPLEVSTVQDPLEINYSLRYTTAHSGSAISGLARWADRLLTHIATTMN